jgi:hypothetical protein
MRHELKTWPEYFEEVMKGNKPFEIRRDDRNYQIGDTLILQEYTMTNGYTDREVVADVTYIFPGGSFGVEDGYCVMGLKITHRIDRIIDKTKP